MRILKVEPNQTPYEKEIEDTLPDIQQEVDGWFEALYLDRGVILCCNEEGKLNGMEMNRRVGGDIICGPFFLVGDNAEGGFTSLSDDQMKYCMDRFGEPEQFAEYEPDAEPRMRFFLY